MSDDLPPPSTKRWVVRRKAAVVMAVRAGVITLEEACRRYHRRKSFWLGSVRLKPVAFLVCAPLAFRITVTCVRGEASNDVDDQRAGSRSHARILLLFGHE